MAHDLESSRDESGQIVATAFFSAREVPWHKLGTVTPDALTAQQALETAYLANWNLRHVPFTAYVEDRYVKRTDRSLVIRTNPFTGEPDILGIVSPTYGIVHNEEGFAFLDAFADIGGAHYETAGSLSNGRRVFMTMRLPGNLMVGGDEIEMYLLATTTHDGTGPFEGAIVPNRVVCRNTLDLAMGSAVRKVRIRHTPNAQERMKQAAELLATAERYADAFETAVSKLMAKKITVAKVDKLLERLFPVPAHAAKRTTITENKRSDVKTLLLMSPTIPDEHRLTGWGFVNAVAEWVDWSAPARGSNPDYRRALRSTFDDDSSTFKTKAVNLVLA